MNHQLAEVIRLHDMWLNQEEGGIRADLSNSDLRGVNLSGADLDCINLSGADLRETNLRGASLRDAELMNTIFNQANMFDVDFRGSNLSGVSFRSADLREADLRRAILSETDFFNADLRDAIGGPVYYHISWNGRGPVGSYLSAIVQDGALAFGSCGHLCDASSENEVRSRLASIEHEDKPNLIKAFETIVELEALRASN